MVSNSDLTKSFESEHQDILNYVSSQSGKPMENVLDVYRMFGLLKAEETMGLPLPDWTKSVYPEKITRLASKSMELETCTPILKKLSGGKTIIATIIIIIIITFIIITIVLASASFHQY